MTTLRVTGRDRTKGGSPHPHNQARFSILKRHASCRCGYYNRCEARAGGRGKRATLEQAATDGGHRHVDTINKVQAPQDDLVVVHSPLYISAFYISITLKFIMHQLIFQ
uniref:Histone deacetylase n=1 Tax=Heterorhabditis bacteriophora TaxID=37862 RepID=A0A1I7XHZ1_HETBA